MDRQAGPIELLLRTATSLADVGTFRWHLARDEVDFSARALAILALPEMPPPSSSAVIDGAFHPDEHVRAYALRDEIVDASREVPADRWRLPDREGIERWMTLTMVPSYEHGVPTEMVGSILDVSSSGQRRPTSTAPLTAREAEVLQMASHGGSSAMIADRLEVSTSTVKTHFEHIYAKLGVADRAGAVAEALRRGLIV